MLGILAFFGKVPLKDWLLIGSAIALLSLGFYAKYVIDDRHKLQEQAKDLQAQNTKMNEYLVEYAKDKNAIEKGKSSAVSRIRKNKTNDTVPPAIADAVRGLYNGPDNVTP